MSKGPGTVEKRIAELFIATGGYNLSITERLSTNPSRALSVAYAFALNGRPASREQRLSATRAAHRLVRRMKELDDQAGKLYGEARREAEAALGRKQREDVYDEEYYALLKAAETYHRAEKFRAQVNAFGGPWIRETRREGNRIFAEKDLWRATIARDGRLYFHPPHVPVRLWADADIVKITWRNVIAH